MFRTTALVAALALAACDELSPPGAQPDAETVTERSPDQPLIQDNPLQVDDREEWTRRIDAELTDVQEEIDAMRADITTHGGDPELLDDLYGVEADVQAARRDLTATTATTDAGWRKLVDDLETRTTAFDDRLDALRDRYDPEPR